MFFCARNILASTQRVFIYLLFFILLYIVRRLAIIQNGAPGSLILPIYQLLILLSVMDSSSRPGPL